MAIFSSSVTVTNTAAAFITTASTSPVSSFTVVIQNNTASDTIYVGGVGVSSTTGIKVAAGSSISLDNLIAGETIYAISSAASSVIQALTIVR